MRKAGPSGDELFDDDELTERLSWFGIDGSAAIINFPEVAMLGLGRILDRP